MAGSERMRLLGWPRNAAATSVCQLLLTPGEEFAVKAPAGKQSPVVMEGVFLFGLLLAAASCGDRGIRPDSPETESPLAELVLELSLGEDPGAPAEYQFSFIRRMLEAEDGTLWVQDAVTQSPLLRLYDSGGAFIRQVGRVGSGPGEYQIPDGMALTKNGRVALRDLAIPRRITRYAPDGAFDGTWLIAAPNPQGGPMQVDTAGVVWLSITSRPGPNRPPNFYLRLRPDGSVLDSVPEPDAPQVDGGSGQTGGTRSGDLRVPYAPRGIWTWSPAGTFAVARTDQYRVEVLPPPGTHAPGTSGPRTIARAVPLIPIPEAERTAVREELAAEVAGREGLAGLRIPPIPDFKPPIKGLQYSQDGRLLVEVSMPSRLRDGEWNEPKAFDVFEQNGNYLGRVILPDSFSLRVMKGDRLWGVYQGEYGVESIRRYRIAWP